METMNHILADTPASKIDPHCSCGRCQFARELRVNRLPTSSPPCRVQSIRDANPSAITNRGELLNLIAQIRCLGHSKTLTTMKFEEYPDEFTRELQGLYRKGLHEALLGLAKAAGAIGTVASRGRQASTSTSSRTRSPTNGRP